MIRLARSEPGAAAAAHAAQAEPAEDERDQQEQRAGVGGDEADPDPGRVLGELVEVLARVDPLGAAAHDDVARQADEQERHHADPQHADIAARDEHARRRREQAADEDHRAEDVDEERQVQAVGTRSRRASGARLPDHVDEDQQDRERRDRVEQQPVLRARRARRASRRGRVCPAATQLRSRGRWPARSRCRRGAPSRSPTAQRMIAAITQPFQTATPSSEIASQTPKMIVPSEPTVTATLATGKRRPAATTCSGRSVRRITTIATQNTIMAATSANALSRWRASSQSFSSMARRYRTRQDDFERSRSRSARTGDSLLA